MRQWTEEERLKQSQAIRRWKAWEHSTGAKTSEGKAISKMNAQKHGLYNAEMKALRQAIREQMKELDTVQSMLYP